MKVTRQVQTRLLIAMASVLLLFGCSKDAHESPAQGRAAIGLDTALASLSRDNIQFSLTFLAADEREGRMTGSRGYDAAAQYVAEKFAAMGLEPGGTDGWFQHVPLITRRTDIENSGVTLHKNHGDVDLEWGKDLIIRSDQYSFVRQGIPAVYFAEGIGASDPAVDGRAVQEDFFNMHYHQPSDDLSQPIEWETALRFARAGLRIGYRIAMEEQRSTWNEGDFFGQKFGH